MLLEEIKAATIDMEDSDKPMIFIMDHEKDYEHILCSDMCITNPYSKVSCLILYLYSMELGSPPLYSVINQVCRTMNKS